MCWRSICICLCLICQMQIGFPVAMLLHQQPHTLTYFDLLWQHNIWKHVNYVGILVDQGWLRRKCIDRQYIYAVPNVFGCFRMFWVMLTWQILGLARFRATFPRSLRTSQVQRALCSLARQLFQKCCPIIRNQWFIHWSFFPLGFCP